MHGLRTPLTQLRLRAPPPLLWLARARTQVFALMDRGPYAGFRASPVYARMYRDLYGERTAARSPIAPTTPRRPSSAIDRAISPLSDVTHEARKSSITPAPTGSTPGPSMPGAVAGTPAAAPVPTRPAAGGPAAPTAAAGGSVGNGPPALPPPPPQSLHEVLKDVNGMFHFREFMERQRATNLINFWVTIEGYFSGGAAAMATGDDATLRQDTAGLFALYFSPDAPQPVPLSKPLVVAMRAFIDNQVCPRAVRALVFV